ncbi:MAG: ABC transporter substrate-binding protein [Phycisphaerae bacterium]|nr:ABC transporter substrate-binding protein [Phycisphaerae bacterium]
MRRLKYTLLIFLIAGQTAYAANKYPSDPNELLRTKSFPIVKDPNELRDLLQSRWDAVAIILKKKDIDEKVKEEQIYKIVSPLFDFPLIAKLTLGRTNWPKLSPPQREEFTRLFTSRLKNSYLKKMKLYMNDKALCKPVQQKNKTIIYVPMQLITKDSKIVILYKLRKVDKFWKIYDVEIQGVSILLTYRSQFDDILRRGTVKDLLSQLEKPADD